MSSLQLARILKQICVMTWLTWLLAAALITAVAAVTGLTPRGTRPVAGTRLMMVGRLALVVIATILVYAATRAR